MWAMVIKEMREVRRDRRTLAMMIVLPVLLLVVFGYAASFDVDEIFVVPVDDTAAQAAARLPAPFVLLDTQQEAPQDVLRAGDASVAVAAEGGRITAFVDGSDLFTAQTAQGLLTAAAARTGAPLDVEVLFNPDLETSLVLVPGLGGLILIFIGSLITSLGVVRERQAGTLEQLAVMPLRASDVFIGKVAPYFLVATVDLVIVLGVGMWLFGVPFAGNPVWLALAAVLFLFTALGIGVLISTASDNQGQAVQLALMTVLPQVLLSGLIFPLASMAAGVRWIGYLLPLTWFNIVAKDVMLKDAPVSAMAVPLAVLAGMALVVSVAAIWRFNTALRPARPGGDDTVAAGVTGRA